jgi:D-alanyl-D-alanine carboxypeptidase/D-alanyl-D-alanine-endopeptidase (penicillin-binding protein 4)
MKIVTATTALAQLGPDYRFRTTFAIHGHVTKGTLHGDLVVVGRGDPTVSDHMDTNAMSPLLAVADSLAAHGIRRITGRIIEAGDAFPDANLGYGWEWDDLTQSYSAGVDELMFNESFATVTVHGATRPGAPARITTGPIPTYPAIHNKVRTVQPVGDGPPATVAIAYDSLTDALVVTGTVALGDSATTEVAYHDPAAAYLYALATAIHARGITVPTHAVATTDRLDSTEHVDTLFTLRSPPLATILPALLKPSQNQIAEVLLKTIGLEKTGVGTADSGIRVVRSQLLEWGAAPDGFVVHDGSGLSRHDYLSPQTVVRALIAIQRDQAFQSFYDALPIAGVDGTIATRMRDTPAANNVRAKTGFIDRARSLSGYVTTADGVPLVFSFLCNNWTTSVRDVERVQDEIATTLASLVLGRP